MIWTLAQRRVVIGIITILIVFLSIRSCVDRIIVSDPPPATGFRFGEVQDKIDPNVADESSFAALPSVGEKRAKEIVNYRESVQKRQPGKIVFTELKDLQRVKGIGPAIAANLEKYLVFPASPKHD